MCEGGGGKKGRVRATDWGTCVSAGEKCWEGGTDGQMGRVREKERGMDRREGKRRTGWGETKKWVGWGDSERKAVKVRKTGRFGRCVVWR